MNQALLNKNDLIKYMFFVHDTEYGGPISRIKLQKGLYFLFSYWVHNVNSQVGQHTEVEDLMEGISNVLFDTNFRAWAYGPVDPEVYKEHKYGDIVPFKEQEAFEFIKDLNPVVAEHVYGMTRRIFNSSDFGLVNLSHQDEAWINHYNADDVLHNEVIPQEEIIAKYEK